MLAYTPRFYTFFYTFCWIARFIRRHRDEAGETTCRRVKSDRSQSQPGHTQRLWLNIKLIRSIRPRSDGTTITVGPIRFAFDQTATFESRANVTDNSGDSQANRFDFVAAVEIAAGQYWGSRVVVELYEFTLLARGKHSKTTRLPAHVFLRTNHYMDLKRQALLLRN